MTLRYHVTTFGCQMNKHDSERIAGLLTQDGYARAETPSHADVLIFNTCCVRESADERLLGQVSAAKALKTGGRPDLIIAVGGCIAQRDGAALLKRVPHIDVVFGTHNIDQLPELISGARQGRPAVRILAEGEGFASDLPAEREHPWHAWVPVTVGCDNFCTYCVVPHVRGRERSRPLEDIVAEAKRLVADGVAEITLLGQNVNSYGRDRYGEPCFADVLDHVSATGIRRIRFATSHPKDLSPAIISAMAANEAVMPYLHLPFQAGSDRILASMNRGYTRTEYLALIERIRSAIPGIALSTDIIVGFPGETEGDFADTLDLFDRVGFDHAFTFIYSPREGTPAASMPDQIERAVAQDRFDRLTARVRDSALTANSAEVGMEVEILVEGESKRDSRILSGRTPQRRLVHVPAPDSAADAAAGRMALVRINEAQSWFLRGEFIEWLTDTPAQSLSRIGSGG